MVGGKKRKDIARRKREVVERDKGGGKKTPEANDMCTRRTRGEEKVGREACLSEKSAGKESPYRDIADGRTMLNEMINNSVKEAARIIAKQCSMKEKKSTCSDSKGAGKELGEVEKNLKTSKNRRRTGHDARYNNLSTRRNLYSRNNIHEDTITPSAKSNDKESKTYSKPASNTSADNRRMTGNVNIYICSEANDNCQTKGTRKLNLRPYADASSDTGRSNARYVSASSASSCKLINNIREKRKKLQAQRPLISVRNKGNSADDNSAGGNIVRDNKTSREARRTEPSESSEEWTDAKFADENVECENTPVLSTGDDGCCCCRKDSSFDSPDLRQDSSESTVPCLSKRTRDDSRRSHPSCVTIYSPEARTGLDRNDVPLSRTIRANAERRGVPRCGTDVEGNDVWRNVARDDEIDDRGWLPKPIYTDHDEIIGERLADTCKYRNKYHRGWTCTDIRGRQAGRKLPQRSLGSFRKEYADRQRSSACTCIAEEEEDRRTSCVERKLPVVATRNDARRSRRISFCRGSASELAADATSCLCASSINDAGECFEGMQTRDERALGDSARCPGYVSTVCGEPLKNSEVAPTVTGVGKEFVIEGLPEDTAVGGMIFAEPNGSPEGITVCETAPPDSEEAPRETICKILDSNSAGREEDVEKRVALNDAEGKLAAEETDDSDLNDRKRKNAANVERAATSPDNFTRRKSTGMREDARRDEEIKESVGNNRARVPSVAFGSIEDPKLPSKNNYSALPRVGLRGRPNLTSDRDARRASRALVDQRSARRMQLSPFHRPPSQVPKGLSATRDFALSSNGRIEEKDEESRGKDGRGEVISKKVETPDERAKGTFLYQSLRKLFGAIKRAKVWPKSGAEVGNGESIETVADNGADATELTSAFEAKNKNDRDADKRPDVSERGITRNAVGKPEVTVSANDSVAIGENAKINAFTANRATRLRPKLLRIIAERKMRLKRTDVTADPKSRGRNADVTAPAEITVNGYSERDEIQREESPRADVAGEKRMEGSTKIPKISAAETKNIPPIVTEIPKKAVNDDEASTDRREDKTEEFYRPCQREEIEERKLTCGGCGLLLFDTSGCSCAVNKCAKCNNIPEDCFGKDNGFQRGKDRCASCCLSTTRCIRARCLRDCLETDKSKFLSALPDNSSRIRGFTDCYIAGEKCECKKSAVGGCRCCCCCCCCCGPREEGGCGGYASRDNRSRTANECRYKSAVDCRTVGDNRCRAATTFVECRGIKGDGGRERTMICLYCDNPRDKCACRAPIGKCSRCELPSDVCACRDSDRDRDRERVIGKSNEDEKIRVTSWEPRREIRRYFSRNLEEPRSDISVECRCYGRKDRRRAAELPYQRLNIFSQVMNELQQKMSESVYCTRCGRNPCRCGTQRVKDQDKKGEERKVRGHTGCHETEKPSSKSSDNCCRCSTSEDKNTMQVSTSIRRADRVCDLSSCRSKKNKISRRRKKPLAKCYYCKSLPCA